LVILQLASRFYVLLTVCVVVSVFSATFYWSIQTRGNSRKLLKHDSASVRDANLLHHRVVNPGNKLPDSVVLAPSMSSYKARLYKLVINTGSRLFCTHL